MILNKAGSGFKLYEVDSESELKALCNKNQSIILGLDNESKKTHYFIEIQQQDTKVVFGLLNGGHGIDPSIVLMESTDYVLISSDKSMYLVDLKDLNNVRHVLCESLVYDILLIQSDFNKILIVCELEVRCLSSNGALIWRYDCDIINDYRLYAGYFEIVTDDEEVRVDLEDGHIL